MRILKNFFFVFFASLWLMILSGSTAFSAEEIFTYQNTPAKRTTAATAKLELRAFPYHKLDPEKLEQTLKLLYPWLKVSVDTRSHQLIVKGKPKYFKDVADLISSLDKPVQQISIEAKIIEVSESGLQQIGILWNLTQDGIRFGTDTKADLEGLLKTLEGNGKAKILATPKITALEDQEAFVRIGDRIPYALPVGNNTLDNRWQINYLDAGIILNIKPSLSSTNNIQIELHPQVINLKEWKPTPAGDFPILSSREAKTIVQVRNGESIAIAGLRNEEEKENITKIPLLGDIPFLGELFKYRSMEKVQTEVIFIITPRII